MLRSTPMCVRNCYHYFHGSYYSLMFDSFTGSSSSSVTVTSSVTTKTNGSDTNNENLNETTKVNGNNVEFGESFMRNSSL